MRNFKRFLALMLTVLMVAGCFALPTSAAASDKFDDVDQYVDAIDLLTAIGVTNGVSETSFGTDNNVTRWQAALLYAKVLTGKTDDSVWKTGVNNTTFKDLDDNTENIYANAISYANNNGIVVGKTTTKFDPQAGITFEQGLTMAVRALGYETAAMKASATTGLWMYIDKAISLGLDAGLEDIIDYKATLTRGQMAQLLYNLVFIETADGYTYAAKSFDLIIETFVLTATDTKTYDIGDSTIKIAATDYIGLSILDAEGKLGKIYYFEEADFMKEAGLEGDINDYVGYSFPIIADDMLSTLYSVDVNEPDEFENTLENRTVISIDNTSHVFTLDGERYTVVAEYTKKLWNKGVKNTANTETLFYNWSEKTTGNGKGYYYYDINGNIVNKEGTEILLHLVNPLAGTIGNGIVSNSVYKQYMVKEGENSYRLPTDADWAKATYYVQGNNQNYYKQYTSNESIENFDTLFAEIKAFDDDNDGAYDRMFYTQYKFGQYTETTRPSDGHVLVSITGANSEPYVAGHDKTAAPITYKGEAVAHGDWIVFAWNADLSRELIVKDVLTAATGYVNGFNTAGTGAITIDNKPLGVNNINLPGTINVTTLLGGNAGDGFFGAADIIGRYVSYFTIGDTVVAFANSDVNKYVVFDGILTVVADNSISVKAYVEGNGGAEILQVASLNGYPLSQYYFGNTQLSYVYSTLLAMDKGTLLTGVKDVNEKWHLYEIQDDEDASVYSTYKLLGATNIFGDATVGGEAADPAAQTYVFENGVAYRTEVTPANAEFQVNANTLFVIVDAENKVITGTFKGIPVNGSSFAVTADTNSHVVYHHSNNAAMVASIVYIYGDADTELTGSLKTTGYDTVVYIEAATLGTGFAENFNGTDWIYNRAVDLSTGTYREVRSASMRLDRNTFYRVKDGYVVGEATADVKDITLEELPTVLGTISTAEIKEKDKAENTILNKLATILAWTDGSKTTFVKNSAGNLVNYLNASTVDLVKGDDKYLDAQVVNYDIKGEQVSTIILKTLTAGSHTEDAADEIVEDYEGIVTADTTDACGLTFDDAEAIGTLDGTVKFVLTSTKGGAVAVKVGGEDADPATANLEEGENGYEAVYKIDGTIADLADAAYTFTSTIEADVTVQVVVTDTASNGVETSVVIGTDTIKYVAPPAEDGE